MGLPAVAGSLLAGGIGGENPYDTCRATGKQYTILYRKVKFILEVLARSCESEGYGGSGTLRVHLAWGSIDARRLRKVTESGTKTRSQE